MFTVPNKELTAAYYGEEVQYSYYTGCSTGGGQGLALALHYPTLFNGIYAGCPGVAYSSLMISFLFNAVQTQGDSFLSQDALSFITSSVVKSCDSLDGMTDGVIENPLKCTFDITSLLCAANTPPINPATDQIQCLTAPQLAGAEAFYTGPKDVRTGATIYPGFSLGSESQWLAEEQILYKIYAVPLLQNLVFNNLSWDMTTFNYGSDVDLVSSKAGAYIDHRGLDLTAFHRAGGKIITSQGWNDPLNPPTLPIEILHNIQSFVGGSSRADISDWYNLFMIPGGGHCGAATNATTVPAKYEVLEPLIKWVEHGVKPEYVISKDPPAGGNRTRRLCSWPKTAKLVGSDSESFRSFECVEE
jgi:feruloyl esterase